MTARIGSLFRLRSRLREPRSRQLRPMVSGRLQLMGCSFVGCVRIQSRAERRRRLFTRFSGPRKGSGQEEGAVVFLTLSQQLRAEQESMLERLPGIRNLTQALLS